MRKIQTFLYAGALSLLSSAAFAHEGHDHSHWSSDALHILFYSSLVAAVAAMTFLGIKQFKNKDNSKSEEI
ncbi:hypothetical protein [Paraglaciecola marina]|uniref:hypothetical protein n=1 Tax=Paraglaciecola marina TaxID=2500157 RepID=UPI00106158DE|nr:hypothetical protein [Paraglaciecola marina]